MRVDCECPEMGSGDWVAEGRDFSRAMGTEIEPRCSGWGWWSCRLIGAYSRVNLDGTAEARALPVNSLTISTAITISRLPSILCASE
jgi:hypothetical protein